jgi:hypothetical protein|tara:strand:+ start:104 stop:529 length:426 start_codon:yes stop_codon:yes gene_type:complete
MGLEGGPEGPEDPIAQICISLGTVRRRRRRFKNHIFFVRRGFHGRRRRGSRREEFLSLRISVFLFPDFFPFSFFDSLFTQVCAMGTTVVAMKDVFKAAKWHDCYKCGGCKEMKCQQCKGTGRVVGQFPEDEFDDEGRFLGA